MNISSKGIEFIKSFEGFRSRAYKVHDKEEHYTIGYGHYGQDVDKDEVITEKQAVELLKKDIAKFVKGVNELVDVTLNQNQFDAIVSFAFNCGLTNLKTSTLLKLINGKKFDAAAREFEKWNKSKGKVLNGLIRRRTAERHLFLKPAPIANKSFSIVDYLKSKGKPYDFASRRFLAKDMGMSHYSGNAEDNLKLLTILRNKWD